MPFIKTNLNPLNKKTADSHVRAVAAACNISWDEAFTELFNEAFRQKETCFDVKVVDAVLKRRGFCEGKIKVPRGSKRPTVEEFAEQNTDKVCVMRISGYYVACAYGNHIDSYDNSKSSLYKYWYKPLN